MPPKKDKKDKKKKVVKQKQKQKQKQTQIVNINLAKPRARSAPKAPVSSLPVNIIRMNEPAANLMAQPFSVPVREPLKEPTAASRLLGEAPVQRQEMETQTSSSAGGEGATMVPRKPRSANRPANVIALEKAIQAFKAINKGKPKAEIDMGIRQIKDAWLLQYGERKEGKEI